MATTNIGNNLINVTDLSYALAHLTSNFNSAIQGQTDYTDAKVGEVLESLFSVLHFKGGIAGASSSPGTYTPSGITGDVYKVTTAGYINGIKVEVNDTLICTSDVEKATASNYTTVRNNWLIIQGNTDGVVIGPASATNNNIAVFDGTTGKLIKNSGYTIATSVPSGAVFTDTKITQTPTTTNATYELLFSNTANNNTLTEGARKTSTLTYNPSTKALVTGGTVNGYTLAAASAKGVDTSIAANSTSTNLPTSQAVSNFANTTLADYARLDGANFTGPVSFGDSVSADDLTAGQLMVTGNASFTNNINANTINGVEVGSNPKFTDTVYTHPTHTSYNNGLYKITINNLGHVTSATAVAKSDITGLGIPAQDTTYSTATSSTLGLVKIGYAANGKNYPVQLSNGQMYVNVPWTDTNTDTNTHYTAHLRTANSATSTSQVTTATSNPYLNLIEESALRDSVRIMGDGATTVTSSADGKTITVKSTDTNTWRGIQNNLTSDSTTDSLSAAQGKALANGSARDNTKLPLAGGTMTGAISRAGVSTSWNKGRDNVLIKTTSINGYTPLWSAKTTNGSWDVGTYDNASYTDDLIFSYITDTNYANNNATTAQIKFLENGHIVGALDGNATTATEFSSNATVALTGDTIGTSAGSKKSWSVATTTNYITNLGRPASADYLTPSYLSKVHFCLASSSMTTHKPPAGDGYITTYHWDNSGWAAQFYLRHDKNDPSPMVRGATNSSNTSDWGEWKYILTEANYTNYTADINGADQTSSVSIYAPTAGGTADTQALVGDGTTKAPKWVNISPGISITAGDASNAPKINVTVLGRSGTAQAITKASTSVYGVTKLSSTSSSSEQSLAATPKLVYDSIAALDVSNITGFGAGKTLATLTETNGKISATFQSIAIAPSQITSTTNDNGKTLISNGTTTEWGTRTLVQIVRW